MQTSPAVELTKASRRQESFTVPQRRLRLCADSPTHSRVGELF